MRESLGQISGVAQDMRAYANQAQPEVRQSQVVEAMMELEATVGGLREVSAMLISRISGVLKPCPPATGEGKANPIHGPRAPLADLIDSQALIIRVVIAELSDAVQRCEV